MILSVSRRTDIPNYYSEWFFNRIKEGFLYVRNPMNPHQVSKIILSPEIIDCIVFWTKNPEPMMKRLDEINAYPYYFQFTLTGYGQDIEPNVLHKKKKMIPIFQSLSNRLGNHRVVWRYDPILFNSVYTKEYHLNAFEQIADELKGYTKKCVISFVDMYAKNRKNLNMLHWQEKDEEEIKEFAGKLSEIAHKNGMEIAACAEQIDLSECGITHSCCIDQALIEEVAGCKITSKKDKNQREECGCIESVDIGCYNTCKNGCKYCYASYSMDSVERNSRNYNNDSPLLCSVLQEGDKITEREMKSQKERQISLFGW